MIVTLIGYRGCGKSSVGPVLAELLNCTCVDSDDEVEARAGKSIAAIFAEDGESVFRKMETEVLAHLFSKPNHIIAAGGGAVLAEVNRQRMRQAGPVVWLNVSAETLASRIYGDSASPTRRPSLTGKSIEEEVAEVLQNRLPLYRDAATITVAADEAGPDEIARTVRSLVVDAASGASS